MKTWIRRASLLSLGFLLVGQLAMAQQVVVDGYGTDRASALKDASRNAVEQVVGTLVKAKTIVDNYALSLDSVYTKAQGFVKSQQVLSQDTKGGVYHVRARIDVDTEPDSRLMNDLQMVMALNDPRIAVSIVKDDGSHDHLAEAALNDRLLSLGFSHVTVDSSKGADFLVSGQSRTQTEAISLPDGKGGYEATQLKSGHAVMSLSIAKFDTGDVIGSFTTTAKGVGNDDAMAEEKALSAASVQAAEQLEATFRHASAISQNSLRLEVYTNDNDAVNELIRELHYLGVVDNVYLREQQDGKAILTVDTTETPNTLLQLLKRKTKLGLYVAAVTANSAKISISR